MNGRFWGSLPLSVFAGVDMPYLYYEYAQGNGVPDSVAVARGGVTSNHFLGSVKHLMSTLMKRDPMRPYLYPKRTTALVDFLKTPQGTRSDVWSFRDPKPALYEVFDMINKYLWK